MIFLFSKKALCLSKVIEKRFIMLQKISISYEYYSFELSTYQRILKNRSWLYFKHEKNESAKTVFNINDNNKNHYYTTDEQYTNNN